MIRPAVVAIAAPPAHRIDFGRQRRDRLLAGAACGFILAVMMANSGGAWDNAKKYIESGKHGGKGQRGPQGGRGRRHRGDPFKDTSGPSINILIKLLIMVSIVFAGVILHFPIM